ncbi:hypothetical protein IH992_11270 [Candidatus Poribacteria bacterium]|nr:hypothetical protein [Candidatus Poribacteria bacterium]
MAKTHRGIGIRAQHNRGRGTCPVCERTGVKVLYSREVGENTINVCKRCNAALSHGKLQDAIADL